MIHPTITLNDLDSQRALDTYLSRHNLKLARSDEITDSECLLRLSSPKWNGERPPGSILLFVIHDISDEPDSTSPVGRKFVPRAGVEPTLCKFIAGMCIPFSFVREGVMPAGSIIWVFNPELSDNL